MSNLFPKACAIIIVVDVRLTRTEDRNINFYNSFSVSKINEGDNKKKSYCDYFCDDKGDQRQRRDWYYSVDIKKRKILKNWQDVGISCEKLNNLCILIDA